MVDAEIIVQLSQAMMTSCGQSTTGARDTGIERLVQSYGGALTPLHPGTDDPNLNRTFAIHLADHERADHLVLRLRALEGIDAAYVKPAGETPGQ